MVDTNALRKDHTEAYAKYEEILKKIQGLDQQKSELTTQAVELQGQLKYLVATIQKEEAAAPKPEVIVPEVV